MLMTLRNLIAPRDAALIVGSGPSAPNLHDVDLTRFQRIAVNNAWRVRKDFDYVVYPGDFPPERHPPASYPARRVDNFGYMPALNAAGGIIFCGATMAFAAGYWAAHSLKGPLIGFYACDMVYTPGKTHFYGQGTADPLREDVSLQSLEAKSARLFCWALERGKLLVNCSEADESRLVFPKLPFTALSYHRHARHASIWAPVLDRARAIWTVEKNAPFDALQEEYWLLADTPEKKEFIADVDQQWLSIVPLIRQNAERAGISPTREPRPLAIAG